MSRSTVSINAGASEFAANAMNTNLTQGAYKNATRAAFAVGNPGLDIGGNGWGCNTLVGTFSVFDVQYDYSNGRPELVSFSASFEQDCGEIKGIVYFNAPRVKGLR